MKLTSKAQHIKYTGYNKKFKHKVGMNTFNQL